MNFDRNELDAIDDVLRTAKRHLATDNSTIDACRLLRLMASKAIELAETLEDHSDLSGRAV